MALSWLGGTCTIGEPATPARRGSSVAARRSSRPECRRLLPQRALCGGSLSLGTRAPPTATLAPAPELRSDGLAPERNGKCPAQAHSRATRGPVVDLDRADRRCCRRQPSPP